MNKKTMHSRVEVHPFCEKLDRINQVLRTPDHNEVIDEKFNIIKKNSLQWIWLCLLAPFYRFFGKDVYSHVRIHRVADQVLELCEIHKSEIDRRAIKNIKKRILEPCNAKTKNKYQSYFDLINARLDALIPPAPENHFAILEHSETPIEISEAFSKITPLLKQAPEKYLLKFEKAGRKGSAAIPRAGSYLNNFQATFLPDSFMENV